MEKLDHKISGAFVVKLKVGSSTYEIELPERWDINPVFHVSVWEPYREDPVGRPQKIIPTPDVVDNEPSYVVAEVVDRGWYGNPKSKFPHWFVQYMVAWEGYGPEGNSWNQCEIVENSAMQALQGFHERYLSKPTDNRVIYNAKRGTKKQC